jgi:hypothetical protein
MPNCEGHGIMVAKFATSEAVNVNTVPSRRIHGAMQFQDWLS